MGRRLVWLGVFQGLVHLAASFSSGAITDSCGNGAPGGTGPHPGGGTLVAGTGAFSISVTGLTNNQYVPGQTYTVTISGNTIKGFMLQSTAGSFTVINSNTHSLLCSGRGALTHSDTFSKTAVSGSWIAPSTTSATIRWTVFATTNQFRINDLTLNAVSPSSTGTPTGTRSPTNTPSQSRSQTTTQTLSPTNTPTSTTTPSNTPSTTVSPSETPSTTTSPSETPSTTASQSNTPSSTISSSNTISSTASSSGTPSNTPSSEPSPSNTPSTGASQSSTLSATESASNTPTPTVSQSSTRSATQSQSSTPSPTGTPSNTQTPTTSQSSTPSPSASRSSTPSSTLSKTATFSPTASPSSSVSASSSPVPGFVSPDNIVSTQWAFAEAEDRVSFTLTGRTLGWAAVGFSLDGTMVGADIIMAFVDLSGRVQVHDCHSTTEARPLVDDHDDLTVEHVTVNNGEFTVVVSRPMVTGDTAHDLPLRRRRSVKSGAPSDSYEGHKQLDETTIGNLMWAYGSGNGNGFIDTLDQHQDRGAVVVDFATGFIADQPLPSPSPSPSGQAAQTPVGGSFRSTDNRMTVSWVVNEPANQIEFTMRGNIERGWMGIGISRDGLMSNSDMIIVWVDNANVPQLMDAFSSGRTRPVADSRQDTTALEMTFTATEVFARFTRPITSSDSRDRSISLDSQQVIWANSRTHSGSPGQIAQHFTFNRGAVLVSFLTGNTTTTSTISSSWKAHGALMVASWGILLPTGICAARFFKFTGKKWFYVHRAAQMIGAGAATIGVIIAYAMTPQHFGGQHLTHSVIGTIVFGLGILNPLVAFVRPHPGEPRRHEWYLAHCSIGYAGVILGVINVFLGFVVYGLESTYRVLFGIWLAILVVSFLIMEVLRRQRDTHVRRRSKLGDTDIVSATAV